MTYEADQVQAAVANQQRIRIAELELQIQNALEAHGRATRTVREVLAGAGASEEERALANIALAEISAHLSPPQAIPDAELPSNVRRLVASGRSGPRFAEPIEQYALGPGGLRAQPRPVAHEGPCDPGVCGRPHAAGAIQSPFADSHTNPKE